MLPHKESVNSQCAGMFKSSGEIACVERANRAAGARCTELVDSLPNACFAGIYASGCNARYDAKLGMMPEEVI